MNATLMRRMGYVCKSHRIIWRDSQGNGHDDRWPFEEHGKPTAEHLLSFAGKHKAQSAYVMGHGEICARFER